MFEVELTNNTYKVFFRYGKEKPEHARTEKKFCEAVLAVKVADKIYIERGSFKEFCSPLDNFNKNKGRKLALAGVLKKFNFSPKDRVLFWQEYFNARGYDTKFTFDNNGRVIGQIPVPRY